MIEMSSLGKLIIALFILAAGVWLLARVSDGMLASAGSLGAFEGLLSSFKQFSSTLMIGAAVIAVILIPAYLYQRRRS